MSTTQTIMLATHGLPEAAGAVRIAARLAQAHHANVHVLAVLEPPPLVAGPYGFVVPVEPVWEERRGALLGRVQHQLQRLLGRDPEWPIDIVSGEPAAVLALEARKTGASLLVMGLGHHHLIERALGGETTLRTLRAAHTPVLAVPASADKLPERAVVAVDFSEAGLAAAQRAIALLPTLRATELVHVAPRWDLEPASYAVWHSAYEQGIAPAFAHVIRKLGAPRELQVTTLVREGKPSRELLGAVADSGADLLVLGSRGLGLMDRVLIGSTATGVLRSATCAVFALPVVADADAASVPREEREAVHA